TSSSPLDAGRSAPRLASAAGGRVARVVVGTAGGGGGGGGGRGGEGGRGGGQSRGRRQGRQGGRGRRWGQRRHRCLPTRHLTRRRGRGRRLAKRLGLDRRRLAGFLLRMRRRACARGIGGNRTLGGDLAV